VAYLLKAITVEPEKQPLLANGTKTTYLSRQRPLLGSRFLIMQNLDYNTIRDVFYVIRAIMLQARQGLEFSFDRQ
jgi:hypothetical protein